MLSPIGVTPLAASAPHTRCGAITHPISTYPSNKKSSGLLGLIRPSGLNEMHVPMGSTRLFHCHVLPACNVCPGLALCSAFFLTPISNKPNGGERLDDGVHRGRTCQTPFQRLKHPPLLPCEMVLPRGCTQTLVRLVRLVRWTARMTEKKSEMDSALGGKKIRDGQRA